VEPHTTALGQRGGTVSPLELVTRIELHVLGSRLRICECRAKCLQTQSGDAQHKNLTVNAPQHPEASECFPSLCLPNAES
jgi:hypothetical protein